MACRLYSANMNLIRDMSLRITFMKLLPHFPGAKELRFTWNGSQNCTWFVEWCFFSWKNSLTEQEIFPFNDYISESAWLRLGALSNSSHNRLLGLATMMSWSGNIFPITGPLCGDSPYKASDTKLWCFLWSAPEQTVEQTIEMPVIWDAIVLIMMSL